MQYFASLCLFVLLSIASPKDSIGQEPIIGERIDGPANIRSAPNGELIFELYDHVLVEATELKNNWYQILVNAEIRSDEFDIDTIAKGRWLIARGDTLGKTLNKHRVSTWTTGDVVCAVLWGYTYKGNIKPETVIETTLLDKLSTNTRAYADWESFIHTFQLSSNALGFERFKTWYTHENTIEDPSPGFRLMLLFEQEELVGFLHSREFRVEDTQRYKLNWRYYVSFFTDYPENVQQEFVDFMNEWIESVD